MAGTRTRAALAPQQAGLLTADFLFPQPARAAALRRLGEGLSTPPPDNGATLARATAAPGPQDTVPVVDPGALVPHGPADPTPAELAALRRASMRWSQQRRPGDHLTGSPRTGPDGSAAISSSRATCSGSRSSRLMLTAPVRAGTHGAAADGRSTSRPRSKRAPARTRALRGVLLPVLGEKTHDQQFPRLVRGRPRPAPGRFVVRRPCGQAPADAPL
jgi:hypothetical protein